VIVAFLQIRTYYLAPDIPQVLEFTMEVGVQHSKVNIRSIQQKSIHFCTITMISLQYLLLVTMELATAQSQ